MAEINAYLAFDGNCREAMNFYKDCLGGDLFIQTVGETPMAKQMPPSAQTSVMHAKLSSGPLTLFASDMVSDEGAVRGNTVSLMLYCGSEEEIRSLFSKLSKGGKVGQPLADQFWGSIYGDFTDKFGMRWMLNYDKPKA